MLARGVGWAVDQGDGLCRSCLVVASLSSASRCPECPRPRPPVGGPGVRRRPPGRIVT